MRTWNNNGVDDGSIHPIGNGKMLVYEQGPNIMYMYGPPYSAPSFLSMHVNKKDVDLRCESQREENTAIWNHGLYKGNNLVVHFQDYMLPDNSIFFRDFDTEETIKFEVLPSEGVHICLMKGYMEYQGINSSIVRLTIPKGSSFFFGSTVPEEINMLIGASSNITFSEISGDKFTITAHKGKGRLLFGSSTNYPFLVDNMKKIFVSPGVCWANRSREFWRDFTSRRKNFDSMIPVGNPYRNTLLQAIDSVSVLIKCQQSESGGVCAGHYYQMGYVRDQASVMRGLLALGYINEAKGIIEFWNSKWELFGNIYNAEGMGNDSSRLLFTNDEVEITAYIILCCFRYYECTDDITFLMKMYPMMKWAFETQLNHLVEGMTEFNGDETYIAGRVYPKFLMYHGSAESTLLFITGGEKLLKLADECGLLPKDKLKTYRDLVTFAKKNYKKNFTKDGVLFANNPLREKVAGKPKFRYSFCEAHEENRKSFLLTWTELNDKGYYVCPQCISEGVDTEVDRNKRYQLSSVSLVPVYIGSDIFNTQEIMDIVKPSIDVFAKRNSIASDVEGIRSLGYDYGLLLYNMIKLDDPLKEKLLEKILSLLDPTGAWVEYYDNDKPYNCRARAWESAINIEAIIEYITSKHLATREE